MAFAESENSESDESKSLLEDFQNECVSIFDFKHAESVKDETKGGDNQPDYERQYVFWNETKKFQRKLRLAQQGNFHQNAMLKIVLKFLCGHLEIRDRVRDFRFGIIFGSWIPDIWCVTLRL